MLETAFSILIICNFASGIEYYTDGTTVWYGGNQYIGSIMESVSGINLYAPVDGDFVNSDIKLKFDDAYFDLRSRSESDIVGNKIEAYLYNGSTATEIVSMNVELIELNNGDTMLTGKTNGLPVSGDYLYTITKDEFPNCPAESEGKIISMLQGDYYNGLPITGKMYQYNDSTADGYHRYIYGKLPTIGSSANTDYPIPSSIWDGTTEVSGSCTVSEYTATVDGIEYKYFYVQITTATNNYLTFDFFDYNSDIAERLKRIISMWSGLSYDSDNIDGVIDFLQKRYFWHWEYGPSYYVKSGLTYVYDFQITGFDFFKKLYESTCVDYKITNNKLYFTYIDYDNIDGNQVQTWETTDVNVSYVIDSSKMCNIISAKWMHDGENGFSRNKTYKFLESIDSIDNYGVKIKRLDQYCVDPYFDTTSYVSAKHYMLERIYPITTVTAIGDTSNTGIVQAGDIVKIKHVDLKTPTEYRYYIVKSANYTGGSNSKSTIVLDDIQWLVDNDNDCKLLVHSWIDGNKNAYNDAANSDCEIYTSGSPESVTVSASLGGCMRYGDGSTKYLQVKDFGSSYSDKMHSAKWDILQQTDYTIFLEVKVASVPGSGFAHLISSYEGTGSNDRWNLTIDWATKKISFGVRISGAFVVFLETTAVWNDTNIHQVAVCKVGTEFGIYFDGAQVAFVSDSSTDSVSGDLFVFQLGSGAGYFNGYIGEIFLGTSNIFDASPVVGLTDTIVEKSNPFSWNGLNE